MIEKSISIDNVEIIHAIYATKINKFAAQFESDVFLKKDGKIANSKSSISILKLFIKRGDRITVLFDGIDEVDTLNAVVDYISDLCD